MSWYTVTSMKFTITSVKNMQDFGARLGSLLRGGEIIELVGDIGAGKTTLTKGIARGMGINDDILSPTFTISRVYRSTSGIQLAHYDFYRLSDAGIMSIELAESTSDPNTVTVIEWAEIVHGVLPDDRITIDIASPDEEIRDIELRFGGELSRALVEKLA